MGFTKSEEDPNLYFILIGLDTLMLFLYIDCLFLIVPEDLIVGCKVDLASDFKIKDIGLMHYFL
jgi:hypothetical protein